MSAVPDEADVLARARTGDREAFLSLVEPELEKIHRLLVRVTGSREEARDLCQEAILKALGAIPSFRGESRFSTWLYRIALNLAFRSRDRASRFAPEDEGEAATTLGRSSRPMALEAVEDEQERTALRSAIASLAPRQRAVVVLRIEDELPFREIADRLELTEGAVKSHYFQATRKLRRLLAEPARLSGVGEA